MQGKIPQNGSVGALHDSKLQNFYYLVVLLQFADYILLCFQATKPWTFALWMDVCLHNEKMIPLFCYNVPGFAVYYKLNRRLFTANRISISFLKLLASSCLYSQHKPDTSLKDGQSGPVPEAALLTESWLHCWPLLIVFIPYGTMQIFLPRTFRF